VSFDEFARARLPALLRYATVVTCDPHLAEDVVQEVLLRAQQRWPQLAQLDHPEAYVKRMVLNEFLSWRRRRAAREVPLSQAGLDGLVAPGGDPAQQVGARDELVRRIAALPPRQRAVVALRYFEGLTDREIADLLGCRELTVRSHASRALAALRAADPADDPPPPVPLSWVPSMGEPR
jgi:RNA polymerase sigma-70 factor (sigma-E family)